jgi:cation:H+ antiporter
VLPAGVEGGEPLFVVWLLLGLGMLVGGAELLVRGGGRIALALRVPVLVVALTIVAFGTSMPEIVVSVMAALRASTDLALANVTGSNIANIALVLGASSMLRPLAVGRELMRREVPTVLLLQLMVPAMLLDGAVGTWDGAALVTVGLVFNALLVRDALAGRRPVEDDEVPEGDGDMLTNVVVVVVGAAVLLGGAQLFVDGATEVARVLGLDDRTIGLTVVAVGTSAPELVTSLVAAWRDEADMAVGNALGSNIINVAFALGATALIHPVVVSASGAWKDLLVALLLTALLVPLVHRGGVVSRVEGAMFVGAYVIYILMLPSL